MPSYRSLKQQERSLGVYSIVPIRYEDRFLIMKWRNEQIYHLRQSRPLTKDDQQRYFDEIVSRLYDNPKPDQILFSYLEDGTCIGYGGLVHINWIDGNAEISFIMDTRLEAEHFAEHWSNYLTMLKAIAFEDLSLHKIYTYAFDLRPHLYIVLEDNGFSREATLKEHCFYNGVYKDVVIHSLWNESYDVINYIDCTYEQHIEILNLRNLDDVRVWMVNPAVIPLEQHLDFVKSLIGNSNRLYYAVYKAGMLLGTYNLSKVGNNTWERGIIANPKSNKGGETGKWEHQILTELQKQGIKDVTAKVKIDNLRSIRYHEKIGYKEQSRDNEFIYYMFHLQ